MPTPKFSRFLMHSARRLMQVDGYASAFVQTSLGKLHYYQAAGSGHLPPMVFLHGMGAHGADLYPLFRLLRRSTQRLVVVDLPAHGWSEAPQPVIHPGALMEMFFEGLDQILADAEPALLFGNSLGGMGAIRYCRHNPAKVRLLILSSPGGARVSAEQIAQLQSVFAHETQHQPAGFINRLYNQPPALRWLVEKEIQQRFGRSELKTVMSQFHPDNLLHPDELQHITMPALLIWGQQDRILENQLHFFQTHLPNHVKIMEPSHFTHCPYMEMPQELAHQIRSFARLHCFENTLAHALNTSQPLADRSL